jgi:hypothetical protein
VVKGGREKWQIETLKSKKKLNVEEDRYNAQWKEKSFFGLMAHGDRKERHCLTSNLIHHCIAKCKHRIQPYIHPTKRLGYEKERQQEKMQKSSEELAR